MWGGPCSDKLDRIESSLPETSAALDQKPMMAINALPEEAFCEALEEDPLLKIV